MRVFDVLACGGFVLAEASQALEMAAAPADGFHRGPSPSVGGLDLDRAAELSAARVTLTPTC